jgi:TIR domain-containing protein
VVAFPLISTQAQYAVWISIISSVHLSFLFDYCTISYEAPMSDIFISYARADEARVRELAEALTRLGWSVWYDRELIPSEEYDERIERELDTALCVIVVWSRESVKSKWVRAEAGAADDQGKLVPVTFDTGVIPPIRFRQLNMAKLSSPSLEPRTEAVNSLVKELAAATGKSTAGWEVGDQKISRAGGRSGAKTVTAGHWLLTARLLGKAVFDLDLLPSGIMTGKGSWLISRVQLSGRWQYDSSRQMLQLEVSGGLAEGIQSMIIQITSWEDDDTATCIWDGRRAQLKRASG